MKTFEKYLKQINEGHGMGSFSGGYEDPSEEEFQELLYEINKHVPLVVNQLRPTFNKFINDNLKHVISEMSHDDFDDSELASVSFSILKYMVNNLW